MKKLTYPTQKQMLYLSTIKRLDTRGRGVRSSVLAKELRVTRPSVHAMLQKLIEFGYVEQEHYGIIYLLQKGGDLVSAVKKEGNDHDAVDVC